MSHAIAFFDVDKTLFDGYSGYYITRELIRRGILKKRRLLKAVLYNTVGRIFKQVDVRRMYEIALADMAGTHVDDIMRLGLEVFEKQVKPRLYTEGLREIEKLKELGHTIILISSGPYMLIKNMEGFLKADDSFSIGPIIEAGTLQRTIQEPLCYKEGKLALAERFAAARRIPLQDCFFYSDSYSDIHLLKKVGKPRAVNPDKYLREEALRRNWPILEFKELLGKA
jgi:HAD superfamily hydrolase (TIGR01490 family)